MSGQQDCAPQAQGVMAWPGVCHWGGDALARTLAAAGARLRLPLVVTDAGTWGAAGSAVEAALAAVPGLQWHVHDGVVPNPALDQVRAALRVARERGCASVLAVGGGSAIDVAKAVYACLAGGFDADELQAPRGQAWLNSAAEGADPLFIAVPTTSGTGSESSSAALIQGDDGRKRLYRSLRARPSLVALQPELTLSLPSRPTAQGGFDAVLHALGAWINTDPSPVGKAMALQALRLCMRALPDVLRAPDSLRARADMQMGAYMAGLAIGMSKVDAVHAMCTPLESRVHMAHAEVLGPIFSVVARHTAQTAAAPYADAARALGIAATGDEQQDALALIEAVESLARLAGIPLRFAGLALSEQDAAQLASQAMLSASMPINPRVLAPEEIQSLYLQMAA
ncbi:iron-containing alcohol dehydrogenase family protein [Achromobacter xylosoxidans]|uniref:iron-containing alcohol dehydrogenase family protein n=1 Tax=Alcaligenes xylosoxydans xylosoxydans TaxID=85698 RepID=UPI000B48DBEE|nr:iron-containing alcohol dehydrogenase [Achromobacter xylosoxidans]